ncbi:MAG TPA: acetate kinase [Clostridiales bacterium]|nr:acetate kinase [Clostridiales bacterium]
MKVLVVNAGSSSLKYQLLDMTNESVIAKGNCEKIGLPTSFVSIKINGKEKVLNVKLDNHEQAMENVIKLLLENAISSLSEIDAVGHRVLHGGEIYTHSVLVDDEVLEKLESLKPLGPLHMPANISGIRACQASMPGVPNVAVFDTAFHSTMPEKAYMYGIKYEDYKDYGIRKYGFHGTSHKFILQEVSRVMGKKPEDLRIISCHIGNGSSITAIAGGKSIDTTMGFTPLEGLMMGTRSGDIDPSVVEYLCDKKGMSVKEAINYLNKKSGIVGVSGVSSDMRELNDAIKAGNKRAKLALEMVCYRISKYVGAMLAVMNGADAIVFTAGVGENQEDLREAVLDQLSFAGVTFDREKNNHLPRGTVEELSLPTSKIKVYRIPTNEELLIARDTLEITQAK